MPPLPDHLVYSTKTQEKRGFLLQQQLKIPIQQLRKQSVLFTGKQGDECVWVAAGECISWTAWQGHLCTTSFSGTILLLIRANWQGRKQGWCVMCYWDKARELVAISPLIQTSFWADRKDLDKTFFPTEDSVQPSSWSKPQVLSQLSSGGCFLLHPPGS